MFPVKRGGKKKRSSSPLSIRILYYRNVNDNYRFSEQVLLVSFGNWIPTSNY